MTNKEKYIKIFTDSFLVKEKELAALKYQDVDNWDSIGHVKMILTTPFCPYGPAMIEMTKAKAVEGMNMPVNIEMGMDMWDFSMMEDPSALDWGMYT